MPNPAPDVKEFADAVSRVVQSVLPSGVRLSAVQWGVYAFYDYEDEPIYVGQSRERLTGRVRRHLTNQRTDAVGMRVLDPYEVKSLSLWPVLDFQPGGERAAWPLQDRKHWLDRLECTIFDKAIRESKFGVILNEKLPPDVELLSDDEIPERFDAQVVPEEVMAERSHPENRIQRRAETLSRLCSVIRERPNPSQGLRRVAVVQGLRLTWLAAQRFSDFTGERLSLDPSGALHGLLGAGATSEDANPGED